MGVDLQQKNKLMRAQIPPMGAYEKAFKRNIGVLTATEQRKLRKSHVAICGLGGLGGITLQMLLRAGVGNFTIADGDRFEISNFNRQVLANYKTLGKKKAKVAAEFARGINKGAKMRKIERFIYEGNVANFVKNADVVVDCLDNPISRIILSRECKRRKIPFVFGSAARTCGMCSVFEGMDFESVLALPTRGKSVRQTREMLKNYPKGMPILGVVPAMIGNINAMQAIAVLLRKPRVRAPHFIFFNAFSKEPFCVRKI